MANYCMNCGTKLAETDKFCAGCGAKTGNAPQIEQKLCRYCGTELTGGMAFCPACGKKAETAQPAIPEQPAPQPGKRLCQSCGKELSASEAFCMGCGAPAAAWNAPQTVTKQAAQPTNTTVQAPPRAVPAPTVQPKAPRKKRSPIPAVALVLAAALVLSLFVWPGFLKSGRVAIKGGHDVIVPPDAFDENTRVIMKTLDHEHFPCEEGFEAVDVISLSAENGQTTLNDDVTVRFQLPNDVKPEEYLDYVCGYFNGEEWEYILPEGFTFDQGYVKFGTPHFSTFALFKRSRININDRNRSIELYAERMAYEKLDAQYQEEALKPVILEALDSMGINNENAQGIIVQNLLKEGDNGYIGSVLVGLQNGDAADVTSGLVVAIGKAVLDAEKNDMDLAGNVLGTGTSAVVSAIRSFRETGDYAEAYKDFVMAAMDAIPVTKYAKIAIDLNNALINKYNDYSYEEMYKDYLRLAPDNNIEPVDWSTVCVANRGSYHQLLQIRRAQYQKLLGLSNAEMEARKDEFESKINDDLKKEFAARNDFEQNSRPQIDAEKEKIQSFLKEVTYTYFDKYNNGYFTEDHDISFRIRYIMSVRNYVIRLAGGDESVFGVDEESQARGIRYAVQEYMDHRKDLSEFFKYMQKNGYLKKGKPAPSSSDAPAGEGYWKLTQTHENWDPDTKSVYETSFYYDEVSGGGGSYTLINKVIGNNGCNEGHDSHDCHGETMTSKFTYTVPNARYAGGETVYMDLNASATTNGIVCYYFGGYFGAQISRNEPGQRGFTFGGWDLTDANGDYGAYTEMVGEYADHSTRKPIAVSRSVSGKMPDGADAKEGDKAYITVSSSGSAGFMVVYEYTWTAGE